LLISSSEPTKKCLSISKTWLGMPVGLAEAIARAAARETAAVTVATTAMAVTVVITTSMATMIVVDLLALDMAATATAGGAATMPGKLHMKKSITNKLVKI
jgi:hypothetical protein